jgi:hypothetical protein
VVHHFPGQNQVPELKLGPNQEWSEQWIRDPGGSDHSQSTQPEDRRHQQGQGQVDPKYRDTADENTNTNGCRLFGRAMGLGEQPENKFGDPVIAAWKRGMTH